jgi:signal transduction histidine kinase
MQIQKTVALDNLEDWKIHFKVEDSGIGIKEDEKDKLFKLFGKLKIKDNINQNGVGLGLTISKKLVEQLGGDIRVDSI